jgi:hypothetical protein
MHEKESAMPTASAPTVPAVTSPTAERPRLPRDYGMPASPKGLLDWSAVEQRWIEAKVYWLATSGPGGVPRVRPLDGIFVDGRLYVGGSPETRWARDLETNPQVSVHLDDGFDVSILEGEAELLEAGVDRALAERLAAESNRKYPQYGMTADSYSGPGPYVIRPRTGFAWKAFPKDLTRFRFEA